MRHAPPPPISATRRHLLQAVALTPLAMLAGCSDAPTLNATFLPLRRRHLELGMDEWHRRLAATRALGCREVFLQWTGQENGEAPWTASDHFLDTLFDEIEHLGMTMHVGLPYDMRWRATLDGGDPQALAALLADTRERGLACMDTAPWPTRAGFRGWFLPYVLTQRDWAAPEREAHLVRWLTVLSSAALSTSGQPPTIGTRQSRQPGPGSLVSLWDAILDEVAVHPMIYDGVGAGGLASYRALAPLHDMLVARGGAFDLIMELFQETGGDRAGAAAVKHSATFGRVQRQWAVARDYGARRMVGFAADPWVIGDTPEAQALLHAWVDARTRG